MDIDLNESLNINEEGSGERPENDVAAEDNLADEYSSQEDDLEQLQGRLQPGSMVKSLEEAYILYCEYARLVGFSVKKGTQSYFNKTNEIKMKMFTCSCEGFPDNKASNFKPAQYKKQIMRTDCKARLRVVREREGPWTIAVFHEDHNHELLASDDSYLLRSARNLESSKKMILESLNDVGVGVSRACRWMEKESGGPGNVGFIRKDAYDHMQHKRQLTHLDNGDVDALFQYFTDKSKSEPYFFFRVLPHSDGRLRHFFRDCRCADDYASFGDVLSIDTTFRTNKYNLICAPFVGLNHHRQNILFGVGFLSDESTESFEWRFTTFLQAMDGKEPTVIFSDQDQALMNGIDYTFRTARHRLCQWHINRNATSQFGELNGDKAFKNLWHHCMNGCESEEEFDQSWQIMVDMYGLEDKNWFTNMYDLRRRWASVFTNTVFTAGLLATSRSEVTKKVMKDLCSASGSLREFVHHYENLQADWRLRERQEDALCRGMPGQYVQKNRLLKHVAKVYTRNVYKIFERGAANNINVDIIRSPSDLLADDIEFEVSSNNTSTHKRKVHYNRITEDLSCSCRMLEREGIFYRHILKVFYTITLRRLPERHILKRWTRAAKSRDPNTWTAHLADRDNVFDMVFVSTVRRHTYDLAMDCKDMPECRSIFIERMKSMMKEVSKLMGSSKNPPTKKRSRPTNLEQRPFPNPPEQRPFPNPPEQQTFLNPLEATHRWLPPKRVATNVVKKNRKCSEQKAEEKGKEEAQTEGNTSSKPRTSRPLESDSVGRTQSAGPSRDPHQVYTHGDNMHTSTEIGTQLSQA